MNFSSQEAHKRRQTVWSIGSTRMSRAATVLRRAQTTSVAL